MRRQPKLIVVTGMKGVGKSWLTLHNMLSKYINKRRILIFDVNNEYGDYKLGSQTISLKKLALKDVSRFSNHPKIEARRIIRLNDDGSLMDGKQTEDALVHTIQNFRNGALIIEDLNVVFGDSLPVSVSGLLCNNRQRNADVVIHFQSCGRLLPKIRQNTNVIRIHRQLDSIQESEHKLKGEYEMFYIAYNMVHKQYFSGNKRYCVYINRDDAKIKGEFTKKMISDSIADYLSENPKVLRPLINKKDSSGNKMYSEARAIQAKTSELIKIYT